MSVMETALALGKAYCDAFNAPGVNGEIIAPFYASDCKFMTPGVPTVYGNENVKLALDHFFKSKSVDDRSKLEMTCKEAHPAGEYLMTSGQYKISSDGKDLDVGKFLTIFKQEDGKWKIFYDMVNSDAAK